jgi:hypothetical protein
MSNAGVLNKRPVAKAFASTALDLADPGMLTGLFGMAKDGLKGAGRSLYKSGLKKADEAAFLGGKAFGEFSDTAADLGIRGSPEEIMNQVNEHAERLLKERDAILSQATKQGAKIKSPDKVFAPVISRGRSIQNSSKVIDSNVKREAKSLVDDIEAYTKNNAYTPAQAPTPAIPPEPVQVPAFFDHELPVKGKRQVTDLYVDVDEPLRGASQIPEQMELPAETLFGQQMMVDQRVPTMAGTARAAVEDPRYIEQLSLMQGIDPQYVRNVHPGSVPDRLPYQENIFAATDAASPKIKPQVSQNTYDLLTSTIEGGQQSLIRPHDVMPPGVGIPEGLPIPEMGGLTPVEMSDAKTQLYKMIDGYGVLKESDPGQALVKQAARRAKAATEASVRSVNPEAQRLLRAKNKQLGALLSGRKATVNEFKKDVTRNNVSSVDGMLALLDPRAALAKKGADISKGSAFRTGVGYNLMNGGWMNNVLSAGAAGAGTAGVKQGIPKVYEYLLQQAAMRDAREP